MLGIAGVGMSGLAKLAQDRGDTVTGCDLEGGAVLEELRGRGIPCSVGHSPEHIDGSEIVVRSTAVPCSEPEILEAYRRQKVVLTRGRFLTKILPDKEIIGVTGSHGKTTTTWLISALLIRGGFDPSVIVGGRVKELGGNHRSGKGQYFVAELDESNGSHLEATPLYSVLTNIDREHTDYYTSPAKIRTSFEEYVRAAKPAGCVFGCWDDPLVKDILQVLGSERRWRSYGLSPDAEFTADDFQHGTDLMSFTVKRCGTALGRVRMRLPGEHNATNALAAIAVALEVGVPWDVITSTLAEVSGVDRRQEFLGAAGGVRVYDDYGHHFTEVKALLRAMRTRIKGRMIGIFQPHRFTRTKDLYAEFGDAFTGLDQLFVMPIYAACEEPIDGVSSQLIVDAVKANGQVRVESSDNPVHQVLGVLQPGDTVITIGAGNVWRVGVTILDELRRRSCQ